VHDYGVREAAKLLRLQPSTIRALIEAGFVAPARGPRNAWRFSFQDLIVLRTAQALASAKVPARRITRSMKELRRHLPPAMPLSGLSIGADADRVIVKEGSRRWRVDSGQYLLAFEGNPADGSLSVLERPKARREPLAHDWFERAIALEAYDAAAAIAAYERVLAADSSMVEAYINLGRLLHHVGRLEEAERLYGDGIKACGENPKLLYNFGVLLEDMERKAQAAQAYEAALRGDPRLADCCYNLALLCEALGKPREAIRYMAQYRRLTKNRK
jgi:tetratricopeptide (TPR) repeat protein